MGSLPEVQEVEQGAPEGLVPGSILTDGRVPALQTFTIADAEKYIAAVRWQFAKTMPQWPHEYTVRRWRPDKSDEFSAFVELIRSEGEVKPWPPKSARPRHHHIYLTVDGWQYWIMDPVDLPVEQVELVNRAEVGLPTSA